MSQHVLSYKEILHRPPPSVAERLPAALFSGAIGAGVGFGSVVLVTALTWAWFMLHDGSALVNWGTIGLQCLGWAIAGAVLFFGYKFLAQSRRLLDRSFYWFALGVTLVGFATLVWFMTSLIVESAGWFRVMQPKVEAENTENRRKLEQYKNVEKMHADEKASLAVQRQEAVDQEADPEEKKKVAEEFDQKIIPNSMKNLEKLMNDRDILVRSIREDTSFWGMMYHFMTAGPSADKAPQDAGILPALVGSIFIGILTLLFAVPLGVGAAIYLEEYRAKGWINKIIQVNITNLAAVPSVFYGILGAFIFVELIFKNLQGGMWTPALLAWIIGQSNAEAFMHAVFGEQIAARNLLSGGMSLALLTLPVVIVAAQEAIRAVPQSLRHGALALGATKWQSIWHHVLPQARSGILTGVILALSRAIGEAAPLVMFGALTFVSTNPKLLTTFTVMPLQIFNWSSRSEDAWKYNTALASLVLMVTLLLLNGAAIWMRQRARRAMKAS